MLKIHGEIILYLVLQFIESMAKRDQPWKDRWEIVQPLPGGGQCTNYIVKRESSGEDRFVLKVIKDESNLERRVRFYREVHHYISLNHPNIPKIVDHNCVESPEVQSRLFFVYSFIEGLNLEDFIQDHQKLNLTSAVELIIQLTDILDYIHKNDIIHRDIKPDNIILRNGNASDPVLIDFGLSAGVEDEALNESGGMQLGNRFLYLPELKINSGKKRDKRSDITYLVGLLFFALTGEQPAHLLDHEQKYPHQRVDFPTAVTDVTANQLSLLLRIFDIGFQHQLNSRFQTIDHFRELLEKIVSDVNADDQSYKEFLKNTSQDSLIKLQSALQEMLLPFRAIFEAVPSNINSDYVNIEVGRSGPSVLPHWEPMCIAGHYSVTEKFKREITCSYEVKAYPNGDEYLLSVKFDGQESIISRFQNINELDANSVINDLQELVLKHFAHLMKKGVPTRPTRGIGPRGVNRSS